MAGQHAFVTGAGRGIGAAIAKALAADGWMLTLAGRGAEALRETCAALPGAGHGIVTLDISDGDAVTAAIAAARHERGPLIGLINNAGAVETAPFAKTDAALWQRMLDINLTGTYHCIQAALPDMLTAGRGRIVSVASTAALKGYAYVSAYTAAKHGVLGLTRALALEVAAKGITVNAVCPGYTDTDIVAQGIAKVVAKTGRSPEQARAEFARSNPTGRLVQPDEVADAVRWLCGPGAASVNGQAISVCGGETG